VTFPKVVSLPNKKEKERIKEREKTSHLFIGVVFSWAFQEAYKKSHCDFIA
jgi:hypothetical protein